MKIINKQIKIEIEAIVNLFIDNITSKKKNETYKLLIWWKWCRLEYSCVCGFVKYRLDIGTKKNTISFIMNIQGYLTFGNRYVSAV